MEGGELWKTAVATGELALMATWGGVLLAPLLVAGGAIAAKGPPLARWLLPIPVAWIVALALATNITAFAPTSEQVNPAFAAVYVALAASVAFGPAFVWWRGLASWRTTAWLAGNLLASLSTLFLIGLMSFTT